MTQKIDVFAHVLLPKFYEEMLSIEPKLPDLFPFIQHPHLTHLEKRRLAWDGKTRQIISYVNVNPEDYLEPQRAALLCQAANNELTETVRTNDDMFAAGVAMIPMNNPEAAVQILEQTAKSDELAGVQLFTRALGKSIADPAFHVIFETCARLDLPIWLHPIFDGRKPDNNIIFSWEYELTQAMLQIVQAGLYQKYPDLKIIVHHAGAMVPFFGERIYYILPEAQVADFHKFYVDTAILGNPKALELTIDYFGAEHVLFGTDAPLGIAPSGATQVIAEAIEELPLSKTDKQAIFSANIERMIGKRLL
ncbi:amidohydrolase family protein [Streptococcus macacae]|uniref:Amidohydrolase family protein n=1 Tax=Streptococcus macacae NCTC 11558 TaxID=764298 RepID=G5JZ36_9STRE|nr:amidohydrolase family protein [Streptococcus macacae]EHJ53315.1 amidohydrolase family protein [Streptococcus macacae NCTC 11558]SUN78290.1 aminocarboxymuconate-semialdehyde decarboxylase [Streptococcus macacae NCTC 11558]